MGQAGQSSEVVGFKTKDVGGGVQNGNAHIIATDMGISQVNQDDDKCSLAASHDTNQKATHHIHRVRIAMRDPLASL